MLVAGLFGLVLLAGLVFGGFYYYKRVYVPKQQPPNIAQQAPAAAQELPPAPAGEIPVPPPPAEAAVPAPAQAVAVAPRPIERTPAPVSTARPAQAAPAKPVPDMAPPAPQAATPARAVEHQAQPPAVAAPVPVQETPTPKPAQQQILKPEPQVTPQAPPAAPKPSYSGPSSGVIVWSGRLEKNASLTINGSTASSGTLTGVLPAVPVIVEVQPADVGVVESPGPSNGWRRIVLRSRANRNTVVTIRWQTLGR